MTKDKIVELDIVSEVCSAHKYVCDLLCACSCMHVCVYASKLLCVCIMYSLTRVAVCVCVCVHAFICSMCVDSCALCSSCVVLYMCALCACV